MDNSFDFKSFDLFKVRIPISYENNYSYKTNVGAVLTIISFLFIVCYTIYHISTLLDRSSYTIISSETEDLEGKIDLSNTPIMFQLLDLYWNPIEYDPKLFTITAKYIETIFENINGVKTRNINIKNLELERCDKLKKEYKALNEFLDYDLTKHMCIKPNQNLILYGSATDLHSDMKSLQIRLTKCNNLYNECYDLDVINKLIESRIFAFTYLGYTTNFTHIDKKKNVEYKIYTNFLNLSKHLGKKLVNSFSKCKLNLFDTFFVTHKTEINYFSNRDTFQDYSFIENSYNSSDELVRFDIMYDGHLIEYTKDINGIGPTFSYIMAAFNTTIIISRIINDYYGNKILFSNLFQLLKKKNINLNVLNKHKNSREVDVSNNGLISRTPFNNYEVDAKGNIIFNIKKCPNKDDEPDNSIKFKEKQKTSYSKYSKKDHWKFCIYPYFLINKNQKLYSIKSEICSVFSVENVLETIKSLKSLQTLRTEFYDQIMGRKIIINSCSKLKEYNDCESKSKIKIGKFSGQQ